MSGTIVEGLKVDLQFSESDDSKSVKISSQENLLKI